MKCLKKELIKARQLANRKMFPSILNSYYIGFLFDSSCLAANVKPENENVKDNTPTRQNIAGFSTSHLCWVVLRTHWDSVSHSLNRDGCSRAWFTQVPSKLKEAFTRVHNKEGLWCTSRHWYGSVLESGRSSSLESVIWISGHSVSSSHYHYFLKQIFKKCGLRKQRCQSDHFTSDKKPKDKDSVAIITWWQDVSAESKVLKTLNSSGLEILVGGCNQPLKSHLSSNVLNNAALISF